MYTKGEWKAIKSKTGLYPIHANTNNGKTLISINVAIAKRKANAQLISAAPELLEACELVINNMTCFLDIYGENAKSDYIVEILNKCEQAIAKAKGECIPER